jgi:hypothetical protein
MVSVVVCECDAAALDLLFLKDEVNPPECLGAGHLVEELPVDAQLIPVVLLQRLFYLLVCHRLARVQSAVRRPHMLLLELELLRVHHIPLQLFNLVLLHTLLK